MDRNLKMIYLLSLTNQNSIQIDNHTYRIPNLYYVADILENQKSHVYTDRFFKDQWCVYMLELADGSYYTGIAKNLELRLSVHRSGEGSKYVRSRLPLSICT